MGRSLTLNGVPFTIVGVTPPSFFGPSVGRSFDVAAPIGMVDRVQPNGIRIVLNDAIKAGGSSLRDHRQTDGDLGYFQHSFRVYDRAGEKCPTPKCKGTIRRIVQGTRSTFFCPVCQK